MEKTPEWLSIPMQYYAFIKIKMPSYCLPSLSPFTPKNRFEYKSSSTIFFFKSFKMFQHLNCAFCPDRMN